jgi:DNA-binding NarL/FixJ family response regulator
MPLTQTHRNGQLRVFVIVEDLKVYRQALVLMLKKEYPGCEIHEKGNGENILEFCRKIQPDIVITDLMMPVKDGYHVLTQLFKLSTDYPVLVLSAYATIKTVSEVTLIGCLGFVDKGSEMKVISEGIQAVIEGRPYYSPYMHSLIKDYFNSIEKNESQLSPHD